MATIQDIHPNMVNVAMKTITEIETAIRAYENQITVWRRAVAALKLIATESIDPVGDVVSAAVANELTAALADMPKRSPLASFRAISRNGGEQSAQ